MNTRGNKKGIQSKQMLEKAFLDLTATNEFHKISVQAICNHANLNRTTFYAHYMDIYDLLEKTECQLADELKTLLFDLCESAQDVHKFICEIFRFVKQHQNFYKACFSGHIPISILNILSENPYKNSIDEYSKHLNFYSSRGVNYHISFFIAGIGEVIKVWLYNGCLESPEEMSDIIYEEYHIERF